MTKTSTARKTGTALKWAAAGAGALAAATLFNRAAAKRAETRYPPIGEILAVDGVDLHVVDTGPAVGGETIVLLHGNGSLVQDFLVSGIVDLLKSRYRVILFDRPGYGHTSRPDDRSWTAEAQANLFVKACNTLGVTAPIVVGHSWGTIAALAWALDYPDCVSRLVLLSGYYYPTGRPDSKLLQIAELPGVKQVFANAIAPLQTRLTGPAGIKMVFSPADTPERFLAEMPFELMLRPTQICASALDGAQMPANVERLSARYGELTLPIALAWGDGDLLVIQDDQSTRFAREVGVTASLILPEAGHMVHHINPAAIVRLIESH